MDFSFSTQQQTWYDAAVSFAQRELRDPDGVRLRDERGEFWREGWRRCGQFGAQGLPVPAEYGGKGQDLPTAIAAMEGLGYGCTDGGLSMALSACLWGVSLPLLAFGSDEQKRAWLPRLCDGTVVAASAASEADAGSDVFAMVTRAERTDGGWRITGRKTWCSAASVADLFVVYASTRPGSGALGISAFLVPAGTPKLTVVRDIPKLGTRSLPMGEIALDGCEVPADALLGQEGRGARVFKAALEWERGGILAPAIGIMRRQLERCVDHARGREQFGQPIGRFQAVSHRIVDMAVRLETARALVYRYAWRKGRGEDAQAEAAMAKLHVSECFVANSMAAVQLFGASGHAVETGLERELRDSLGSTVYSGTSEIQRAILARCLGLP